MILAITGHRPNKLNNEYNHIGSCSNYVKDEFKKIFKKLSVDQIISGAALGADLLAIETAIELQIPVTAAIPCDNQEKIWPKSSQDFYRELLQHPLVTKHIVCPGPYQAWKMFKRNRWMVNRANYLVAVWNGTRGGTYDTVDYARSIQMPIHVINPDDWQKPSKVLTLF